MYIIPSIYNNFCLFVLPSYWFSGEYQYKTQYFFFFFEVEKPYLEALFPLAKLGG